MAVDDKYPDFIESTGYGSAGGICGINCRRRHSFFPFFEGLSPDVYQDAGIDPRQDKTVTHNGQEMSLYEATQRQRGIERKIRRSKREASALEAAGLDSTSERAAVRRHQAEMRDFTRQTGIDRQRAREQIYDGANVRTRP